LHAHTTQVTQTNAFDANKFVHFFTESPPAIEYNQKMTPMDEPRQPAEWPVLFARRALKMGRRVPEIEEQLVSQGLSPEEANKLVMGILESG
jgi:hypothetical protein